MEIPALAWGCLSFLAGVALASLDFSLQSLVLFWGLFTLMVAGILPRFWRLGPRGWQWGIYGLLGVVGTVYVLARFPQPPVQDLSHWVTPPARPIQTITAIGTVIKTGQPTGQGGQTLWLQVNQGQKLPETVFRPRDGRLYVFLPPDTPPVKPCEILRITGRLSRPRSPQNPGQFDFSEYLARQGIFTTLWGNTVEVIDRQWCPFVTLRDRLVQTQTAWLPPGEGQWPGLLLSSMVLGQQAVSLPGALRQLFQSVGLSHILVASGYQVSLIGGLVWAWGQRFSPGVQALVGVGVLGLYLGLTGLEPSVVRAALMAVGVALGNGYGRKVNSLGGLLLVATIMTLVSPVALWGLGFQLSFLATLGIVVMAQPLQTRLDFLPPRLGEMIAVPVAASVWTLPLLLAQFGQWIPVALPLNVIIAPLVALLSLGGMVSTIAGLILPTLGSALAWGLALPARGLLAIATYAQTWPTVTVGTLGVGVMVLLYGLLMGMTWVPFGQKHRLWGVGLMVALVLAPWIWGTYSRVQVTVLAGSKDPILVAQQGGRVTTLAPAQKTVENRILKPFLTQQGIQTVQCALRWSDAPTVPPDCPQVSWQSQDPPMVALTVGDQRWWIFPRPPDRRSPPPNVSLEERPEVMIWSGRFFPFSWLEALRPPTAIALAPFVSDSLPDLFTRWDGQLWVTGEVGPLQWTPQNGWQPLGQDR